MAKKYIVQLEAEEPKQLMDLVSKGRNAAGTIRRARVLLQADISAQGPGWKDAQIAQGLDITVRSIEMLRRRFVEEGLEACLKRREPRYQRLRHKLDGEKQARLIAISCSAPPPGRVRWTLRLLADQLVELQVVDSICHETIRRVLKKAR
jgi:transposase